MKGGQSAKNERRLPHQLSVIKGDPYIKQMKRHRERLMHETSHSNHLKADDHILDRSNLSSLQSGLSQSIYQSQQRDDDDDDHQINQFMLGLKEDQKSSSCNGTFILGQSLNYEECKQQKAAQESRRGNIVLQHEVDPEQQQQQDFFHCNTNQSKDYDRYTLLKPLSVNTTLYNQDHNNHTPDFKKPLSEPDSLFKEFWAA